MLRGADAVLVPGIPSCHGDHLWLTRLVLGRDVPAERLGFYVEQPYARSCTAARRRSLERSRRRLPVRWAHAGGRAGGARRREARGRRPRTARSCGLVSPRSGACFAAMRRYESARGGESVGWIYRTNR